MNVSRVKRVLGLLYGCLDDDELVVLCKSLYVMYALRIDSRNNHGIINMDASQRLAYGLCKREGIDTKGMTPREAWEALKEKTGKGPDDWYDDADALDYERSVAAKYSHGELGKEDVSRFSYKELSDYIDRYEKEWRQKYGDGIKVNGPEDTDAYLKKKKKDYPNLEEESKRFEGCKSRVDNFLELKPDAEDYQTYDSNTLEPKEINNGFCVTFHQNGEGYTEKNYAEMTAVAVNELGSDGYNIGYYGNPEISFWVDTREGAADYGEQKRNVMKFAVEHNQDSIYEAKGKNKGVTWYNPFYNEGENEIEGSGYFGDRWG